MSDGNAPPTAPPEAPPTASPGAMAVLHFFLKEERAARRPEDEPSALEKALERLGADRAPAGHPLVVRLFETDGAADAATDATMKLLRRQALEELALRKDERVVSEALLEMEKKA